MPTALKADKAPAALKGQWALGDLLETKSKHHKSIKSLWETKWKMPVRAHRKSKVVIIDLQAT